MRMKIEKEPLLPGEETFATFNIKSEMSAGDLAFWGPGVTDEMCRKYSIYSLVDYSAVHGDFRCRYFSTKDYPIFLFMEEGKVYMPFAERDYRFRFYGRVRDNYLFGFEQLKRDYEEMIRRGEKHVLTPVFCDRLKDVFLLVREGLYPLYKRSETQKLTEEQKEIISKCARNTLELFESKNV